ncbi:hypothetical protein [Stenotrophomonas sp.]|uniref:hypothetical protein n=1 Tax=Stenotrophomonas sp. TaxID=69392 RepID=UPI00289C96F7|nr:hypothetical protein [Stenotrophomonas sp.]
MKTLSLLSLLVAACTAVAAHAAEPAPAAACITLGADQQIVRANANSDVLLRNGDQHYLVRFTSSCTSAALSPTLEFVTHDRAGELCSGGVSSLRTKSQTCAVSAVESISAKEFATRARARR